MENIEKIPTEIAPLHNDELPEEMHFDNKENPIHPDRSAEEGFFDEQLEVAQKEQMVKIKMLKKEFTDDLISSGVEAALAGRVAEKYILKMLEL